MWRIFAGALLLVIAGIAAFIEAHSHDSNTNARAGWARANMGKTCPVI
jgi:hypothetical protein